MQLLSAVHPPPVDESELYDAWLTTSDADPFFQIMDLHRKYRREQVKSITDFAESLHNSIIEGDDISAGDQINTVNQYIDASSQITHTPDQSSRLELDTVGTKLWNACTRLMRKDGLEDEVIKGFSQVRALAFFMLECAAKRQLDDPADDVRLLRTAVKSAKTCITLCQLDLALKILEKAALREERLSAELEAPEDQQFTSAKLSVEYYMLRTHLAWKQNRLDFAEHMLSKIPQQPLQQDCLLKENLSDLMYDIGRSLMDEKRHVEARKWLQRAYDALPHNQSDTLSPDASGLRLCVLHALVRVNLAVKGTDSESQARELFAVLDTDYGHKPEVLLLSFDVIQAQTNPDCQLYYDRLCTFLRTAPAADSNWNLMIHHVHNLYNLNKTLAADALELLLIQRFATYDDGSFFERGFATYVWMRTTGPSLDGGLELLRGTVGKVTETRKSSLSGEATHATLILIWKKVSITFDQKDYETSKLWCKLLLHPFFENLGETNKSKVERKLILCALELKDTTAARKLISELSETCKSEALTQYLMYRVAIQDEDLVLARECLSVLCGMDSERPTYLLACVAEALHSGAERQAAIVLQQLLDHLDDISIREVYFPALLRCSARLLISELKQNEIPNPELADQICKTFESLTIAVSRAAICLDQLTISELEWFSRMSYNLSIQNCTTWESRHILSLLDTCIKIVHLYPDNLGLEAKTDTELRESLCHFLAATILIAQARVNEVSVVQTTLYRDIRQHIQDFRKTTLPGLNCVSKIESLDLIKKYRTMLAFDFEAAVKLKQWDDVAIILHESRDVADEPLYSLFVDMIICSEASMEVIIKVFENIIQTYYERDLGRLSKVSRWIRCIFQLCLESNPEIAESIAEQAYVLARDGPQRQINSRNGKVPPNDDNTPEIDAYPQEEVEWLSTTSFNFAIDLYLASDDSGSRRWYNKALDLARLIHDDGGLWQTLQEKYGKLSWDD